MRQVVFFFVFICFAVTATSSYAVSNQLLIERAKKAVREKLKDPEAARFRNVRKKKGHEGVVIGEVNAKNSFGAYVGYDRFYVSLGEDEPPFVAFGKDHLDALNKSVEEFKKTKKEGKTLFRSGDSILVEANIRLVKWMFVDGWE